MTYIKRLKDPRWQRKRLEILQREDFTCEDCGARDKTLHVHHKLYRKGAKPWEYSSEDLQVLCEDCHERVTDLRAELDRCIASEISLGRLVGYAHGLMMWEEMRTDAPVNYESSQGLSDAFSPNNLEAIWDIANGSGIVTHDQLDALFHQRLGFSKGQ